MNVSPEWKTVLGGAGHTCVHRSEVGDPRADDVEIMGWAASMRYIVFTHDLDFGTILFHTKAKEPSVVQVRGKDVSVGAVASDAIKALHFAKSDLETGAILTIDSGRHRIKVLPFAY